MGQPLSVESKDTCFFITKRTKGSRLWFVNNRELEGRILAHLAKYCEDYGALLFAFVLMGNHYHAIVQFPSENRADFLRDFDAIVVSHVKRHVSTFRDHHTLWDGPPRWQALPNPEDVEFWAFYVMLNPISSGLVQSMAEFDGYSSLGDSISGRSREFKIFHAHDYNQRKRYNKNIRKEDFISTHRLSFARLPGYEGLSQKEYRELMLKKLEKRRREMVEKRLAEGKGFAGQAALRAQRPGSKPNSTKKRSRMHRRPLVLTLCAETRRWWLSVYFSIVEAYRKASALFRAGKRDTQFPPGTHLPVIRHRAAAA